MIDPSKTFSKEEKTAIDVLLKAGFVAFAEVKVDDVRELGTGRRRRTYRANRRYALALLLADDPANPKQPSLRDKARAARAAKKKASAKADEPKTIGEMNKPELLEEAQKLQIEGAPRMNKPDLLAAVEAANKRRELLFKKI